MHGNAPSRLSRGEIYECHFGTYRPQTDEGGNQITDENQRPLYNSNDFQGPIPSEIQKKRPVVILGDHKGQYLVVPISTTQDTHNQLRKSGEGRGFHIPLGPDDLPDLPRYKKTDRAWAKANMIQTVDRKRLKPLHRSGEKAPRLSAEKMKLIQEGLIKSIGAQSILDTAKEASAQEA